MERLESDILAGWGYADPYGSEKKILAASRIGADASLMSNIDL